eukprot:CAMPEP_0204274982 /NCGR_PEP_ID=MMETSP0468-20130131/25496_1 /ASSEMBLY_ACC=CAM_ASM_000383 /TAXON_ID=2969 /ORGANISM="Oxyrrhis marina" /LENGTH=182 /DNA_ID=CAMNT_0051251259 /DNA_START=131 /DNA_END=681 /DNA_ORIENTATION=-
MVLRLLVLVAVLVAAVVDGTSSFRSNLLQRLRRTQQPWAWMPPIPMGPRAVLPTVDGGGPVFPGLINNPPHTHPTVPPLMGEDGKVLRLPPPGLEGWYIKPPPGPLYEGWKHYEDAGEEEQPDITSGALEGRIRAEMEAQHHPAASPTDGAADDHDSHDLHDPYANHHSVSNYHCAHNNTRC